MRPPYDRRLVRRCRTGLAWLLAAAGAAGAVAAAAGVVTGATGGRIAAPQPFDHELHAGLFPSCVACHRGAAEAEAPMFPSAEGCATCHDGTDSLEVVEWAPRPGQRPTNLVFAHGAHRDEVAEERGEQPACVDCHAPEAASWMTVERSVVSSCLDCHGLPGEHLGLSDETCATCHSDLADSPSLDEERVAGFAAPPSHERSAFRLEHGEAIDASCAICHAREFCAQCHVNAPEVPEIAGLASDPRSLAIVAAVPELSDHEAADFLSTHGATAAAGTATCASCHTAESCTTCHIGSPQVAASLPPTGPERGRGALVVRERPPSHDVFFLTAHGPEAAARPETCAGCHVRSDCTKCHRPGARAGRSFHPIDFMARHPAAAYARQTSCSDCHAPSEFCTSCHASAGLAAGDVLASSFHDGQAAFSVGHGAAARLNLETCASCHAERDCLACHSSVGGRGIDPHGPDFDAEALRRGNPQMCTACHGSEIPPTP